MGYLILLLVRNYSAYFSLDISSNQELDKNYSIFWLFSAQNTLIFYCLLLRIGEMPLLLV
jgi:hypothetical protein